MATPRTVDGELNRQDRGDRGCVAYTLRMASPREKEWIWGGEVEGAGRSGGRGHCGWDVISEKRINKT